LNFKTKYCDDLIEESIASTIIKSFFRIIILIIFLMKNLKNQEWLNWKFMTHLISWN